MNFLLAISLLSSIQFNTLPNHTDPVELGEVNWLRDIDEAVKVAEQRQKPILILFQEVPGCSTCSRYGKHVLSHPLIVEAIEEAFVPLAIFNNRKGKDAATLAYFNEPSWNNPVVRIIDNQKRTIGGRLAGNYSRLGLVNKMLYALDFSGIVLFLFVTS